MPDLPTLTVTNAQAQRMIAAYGGAVAYRRWLRDSIVQFVKEYETAELRRTIEAEIAARMSEIEDVMPAPVIVSTDDLV